MLNEKEKTEIKKWYEIYHKKRGIRNKYSGETERQKWLKNNPFPYFNKIVMMYEEGHGYKHLAKETGLPYNFIRSKIIQSDIVKERTGCDVVTGKLREKRRENASNEKSNWYDWPRRKPFMLEKTGRSIQGFYQGRWLRSTYEYIYAKWLNKMNVKWSVEDRCFELSNGERYRPDFFVYDSFDNLICIVEVKSRYFNKDNREYKFDLFKEEYPNIQCFIVTDINRYIDKKSNYHKELKEWKKIKKSSEEN